MTCKMNTTTPAINNNMIFGVSTFESESPAILPTEYPIIAPTIIIPNICNNPLIIFFFTNYPPILLFHEYNSSFR